MLNNQGRKIVKEKRGEEVEETHHYFNIEEEQAREFDRNWEQVNQQNKFLADHGRYLGYAGSGPAMIAMGPTTQYQQQQPRRIEYQQAPVTQQPIFRAGQPVQPTQVETSTSPYRVTPQQSQTIYGPQPTTTPSQLPQQVPPQQPTVNTSRLAQNPFFNRQPSVQPSTYQQPNPPK